MAQKDVLIIGAGPVGLTMANQLARYGVDFEIIDQKAGCSLYSKALGVHARTLEMFDMMGMVDKFLDRGLKGTGLEINFSDGLRLEVDVSHIDGQTSYPYLLILPQSETEKILEENLKEKFKHQVKWSHELMEIRQTSDGVEAVVNDSDGTENVLTAKYLIACDGAHSRVRHLLNTPFEGSTESVQVMLGDVKIDPPLESKNFSVFASPKGVIALAPFKEDYTRVIAIDFAKQDRGKDVKVSMDDLQDSIANIRSEEIKISDPFWLSQFTASHRQVPQYRYQNIFYAGDAAHIHNPLGGQGMNLGIQDAVNLSWKLAMALKRNVLSGLLDTYYEERHPIAASVLRRTDFLLKMMTLKNKRLFRLRNFVAGKVTSIGKVQEKLAENVSQLVHNYKDNKQSLEVNKASDRANGLKSGARVADASFQTSGVPVNRMYRVLRDGKFVLLVRSKPGSIEADVVGLLDYQRKFEERFGEFVRPFIVTSNQLPLEQIPVGVEWIADDKGELADEYGLREGSLLLVRPDGYASFSCPEIDFVKLEELVLKYLCV
ncbi:FAD-dependent monooxygenase [Falsibacillus albus]|uniref:FAD-dependent monooxygenase n=1 Tax=Falsibacillus albus TaxID=2478915 RepID=UPI0013145AAD|nr:FAD-dependent monooxygenase [Falsibacillus albus]